MTRTNNPLKIIGAAVKSLFDKENLSFINIANVVNIAVIVLMHQLSENPTPMGLSLFLAGMVSVILNKFYPEKMLVNSGIDVEIIFYIFGFIGVLAGCTEMMSASMKVSDTMDPKYHMWVPIAYSFLMIYIRTGYTNQEKSMP